MILRSSSSVRRAGATGPRSEPLVGIRSGWTSSLRIARDSYHSAAHYVNASVRKRRFARVSSAECAMCALDRAYRRLARIPERGPVAGRKQLRLERPQPAGRFEGWLLFPRRHRSDREGKREVARDGDSAESREHVARDQRAVSRVEEGHVPRRMPRGLDRLEAVDAVAGLEEHVRLRLQLRPGTRELVVDDALPRVDAGVELGHRDLHVAVEPAAE